VIEAAIEARTWVSTPFHWEASLKGIGCDCRGLLTGIARELDRPEAETIEANVVGYTRRIDETALLAGLDRVFARKDGEPEPGDVLAFRIQRKVQHLGVMIDRGRFVHAYSPSPRQVLETPLSGLWLNRLAGVWAWR
jgi:NlpC/P60 family putative phage cell wall peptidase